MKNDPIAYVTTNDTYHCDTHKEAFKKVNAWMKEYESYVSDVVIHIDKDNGKWKVFIHSTFVGKEK